MDEMLISLVSRHSTELQDSVLDSRISPCWRLSSRMVTWLCMRCHAIAVAIKHQDSQSTHETGTHFGRRRRDFISSFLNQ